MYECWEQRERELTDRQTVSSIVRLFWTDIMYVKECTANVGQILLSVRVAM